MIGWLIFGFYAIGYVLAWRRIAWIIANDEPYLGVDGDIAFGIIFGAFLSLFWPLIVPVYYLHRSGLLMSGRRCDVTTLIDPRPLDPAALRGLQAMVGKRAEEWAPACEHDTQNPWLPS